MVDLDSKKMTERQFAHKYGVRLTPVFMFFDQIGRYVVEGHYKNTNLIKFIRENSK